MPRLATLLATAALALSPVAATAQTTPPMVTPSAADTVGPFGIEIGALLPMAGAVLAPAGGTGQPLSAYSRSSGLVVVLWGNRCPWVERYDARVAALAQTFGDRFGVVLVSTGSAEDNAARATENAYAMPYLSDAGGAFVRALGAVRAPQAYVFDASGRLAYSGAIDDSPANADRVSATYLADALTAVAGGKAPATPRTEALGCLIR